MSLLSEDVDAKLTVLEEAVTEVECCKYYQTQDIEKIDNASNNFWIRLQVFEQSLPDLELERISSLCFLVSCCPLTTGLVD